MNKYTIVQANSFKKDRKRIAKQHKNMSKLKDIVNMLANGETLHSRYRDHNLIGNFIRCLECHNFC